MDEVTKHLIISGRVQGVGFRAFVLRNAEKLNIKGWVKNKYNGEVEAVISGSKVAVNNMLLNLKKGSRWARVKNINVISNNVKKEFDEFRIRY